MPILKSFLKDKNGSGADAYKNVDINFIRGRKAILTIYDVPDNGEDNKEGWIEKEQLVLSEYKTKVCCYVLSSFMASLKNLFGFSRHSLPCV